jgi:hypothetical protein
MELRICSLLQLESLNFGCLLREIHEVESKTVPRWISFCSLPMNPVQSSNEDYQLKGSAHQMKIQLQLPL